MKADLNTLIRAILRVKDSDECPQEYLAWALTELQNVDPKDYGKLWCDLKMEFCQKFQDGLIFSTRFGMDFFSETLVWLMGTGFIQPQPDGFLSEYDRNFNTFLKKWR